MRTGACHNRTSPAVLISERPQFAGDPVVAIGKYYQTNGIALKTRADAPVTARNTHEAYTERAEIPIV
ncbi:hypothetical protein BRC86_13900 [Halobacteriales archaeon QS_3_64_16]|nr:MAG: hypothetical protein BRC86_13900 [Halobacteriales archaeon QS_3_64_16]